MPTDDELAEAAKTLAASGATPRAVLDMLAARGADPIAAIKAYRTAFGGTLSGAKCAVAAHPGWPFFGDKSSELLDQFLSHSKAAGREVIDDGKRWSVAFGVHKALDPGRVRLRLQATEGALVLGEVLPNWWQLELHANGSVRVLGTDGPKQILERLRAALEAEIVPNPDWKVEGVSVFNALSLAEVHTSIYVGESEGRRLLFLQDLNAVFFAKLALTESQRAEWYASIIDVEYPR